MTNSGGANVRADGQVAVWDGATRLFHWLLVALFISAWASHEWGDAGLVWHTWNGYAVLVLVVWRLLWGFIGSSTSRFSAFVYGPAAAFRYGIDFLLRRPRHFLGHNPLGGLSVLALLALVGGQALLGLFAYDDHDLLVGGPLSSKVPDAVWAAASRWHHRLFDLLWIVVVLHIVANVLYLVWKGENLVRPMITGRKPSATFEDAPEASLAGWGRAFICLLVAAAIVFGGILAAGGRLL
ncbi:MAG: cytochrome b/b6 domain-containing protein [Hyphomicrobiaceae bacterium]